MNAPSSGLVLSGLSETEREAVIAAYVLGRARRLISPNSSLAQAVAQFDREGRIDVLADALGKAQAGRFESAARDLASLRLNDPKRTTSLANARQVLMSMGKST